MDLRPRVICGFPGVGKSTLFTKLSNPTYNIKISDLSTSEFVKSNLLTNYIQRIKELLVQDYWVLCSTEPVVRQALAEAGIGYVIAAPISIDQKDEYMQRYRNQGSPESFLKLMDEKFEEFVRDVQSDKTGLYYGLDIDQYLDTILEDIIASDAKMKRLMLINLDGKNKNSKLEYNNLPMDYLKGFEAGQYWEQLNLWKQMLRNRTKEDFLEKKTFIRYVRASDLSIYRDMILHLGLDFTYKNLQNPQIVEVTAQER